jgi:hypothetical protein
MMRKHILLNQKHAPCDTCDHAQPTPTGFLRCTLGAMRTCGGTYAHADYTPTGRRRSSDPNLQNVPVQTREGHDIRAALGF